MLGGQFLSIVSEFLSYRRQRVCSDEVSASVNEVSGVPQSSDLGPLSILYTSKLLNFAGNNTVGYADDTTIYAVIPRPLLGPQVMEWLNQDVEAITASV